MMRTIAPILFGFLFCISANAATVLVIAEGDSITAGNGTTGGSNWVNQLGYFINDIKVTCTNIALSGDTVSNNIAATDTINRLVIPADRKIAICALGSNDIGNGDTAQNVQTNFLYWIANVRSNNPSVQIVMTTIMDRVGIVESKRTNVNEWIKSSAPVNLVVDIASDARLNTAPDAPYFADAVHPSNTGAWVVASNIFFNMNAARMFETRDIPLAYVGTFTKR